MLYWHMLDAIPGVPPDSKTDGVKLQIIDPEQKIIKEIITNKGSDESKSKGKYSFATQIGI